MFFHFTVTTWLLVVAIHILTPLVVTLGIVLRWGQGGFFAAFVGWPALAVAIFVPTLHSQHGSWMPGLALFAGAVGGTSIVWLIAACAGGFIALRLRARRDKVGTA